MKNAFRIGYYCYINDNDFAEHLAFIKENIENVDEIALFVEFSHHGYWPLEGQEKMADILSSRINEYRKIGVKSVGLNVLDTIGHLEESWGVLPKPPMQTMVGKDGRVSNSCLCPNTKEFREYIAARYAILSKSKPDFIWVDDDLRIVNHGVADVCLCPTCIEKFNKKTGRNETFESLAKPTFELENLWVDFWNDCLTEVCEIIKNAVKGVDDSIEMGLMSGYAPCREWFENIGAEKGRPGGGVYTDEELPSLSRKILDCESQLDIYPKSIEDLQYEFENFPYEELGKSRTMTELEVTLALMSGCNGIAFNAIYFKNNPMLLDCIKENKSYWDAINKRNVKTVNNGIYCGRNHLLGNDLLKIGLPITGSNISPSVRVLDESDVLYMPDEEIKDILSKNVFITGKAFELIEKRGFGYLCGVEIDKIYTNGVYERYTDDEINGKYAGDIRNSFISFNGKLAHIAALKLKDGARELSRLVDVTEKPLGTCFALFKNELGGRVAVCTYLHSEKILYLSKRRQLINAFNWLSEDSLVDVLNDCKVMPFYRKKQDGGYLLCLANMSYDRVENLEVEFKTDKNGCVIINKDGFLTNVEYSRLPSDKIKVQLGTLEPWKTIVLSDE